MPDGGNRETEVAAAGVGGGTPPANVETTYCCAGELSIMRNARIARVTAGPTALSHRRSGIARSTSGSARRLPDIDLILSQLAAPLPPD